jgi:hypothetical protein
VFVILIYVYLRAKNYYAIGLYPVLLAFGSVYLEKILTNGWRRYLRPVAIVIPVVTMIPMLPIMLPVLSPEEIAARSDEFKRYGLTTWEDGKVHEIPQDYADMIGWKELAGLVDSAFELIEDKDNTLILCHNYGQAGSINFYATQGNSGAVTMHTDYINWFPLNEVEINNVILVRESNDTDINREEERPLFEEIIYIGEIENRHAREKGTRVFLLKGAKQSINERLRQEIKEQQY